MRVKIPAVVLSVAILLSLLVMPALSEEPTKFTVSLEFYDAASLPSGDNAAFPGEAAALDPLNLAEGQRVVAALRYSGLDAMNSTGIQCLAVSFTYDYSHFVPGSFSVTAQNSAATEWSDTGKATAAKWMSSALTSGYTAHASDSPTQTGNLRKVYLQFIGEGVRNTSTVEAASSGYLGAFSFTVKDAFTKDQNVYFTWNGVDLGFYGDSTYTDAKVTMLSNAALEADTGRYTPPTNVLTAAHEVVGVKVSGSVVSYNPKNPTTVELHKDSGEIYSGTIAALAGTGQQTQTFEVTKVPKGNYTLVVKKPYHLTTRISNIVINGDVDVALDMTSIFGAPAINLIPGDLDGDGYIDLVDGGIMYSGTNYGVNEAQGMKPANPEADIDGDGYIDLVDGGIMYSGDHYDKNETQHTTFTFGE